MLKIHFTTAVLAEIQPTLAQHLDRLLSPIDSFLEDYILNSNHYHIWLDEQLAGWASVHQERLITQFALFPPYRRFGQDVFRQVRRLEKADSAFVTTCDEFFLSHALDDYRQIEKQAYFFQHDSQALRRQPAQPLACRQAGSADIATIQTLADGFFDKVEERLAAGQLYLTLRAGECVGFGIIEKSVLLPAVASIGMFTVQAYRNLGIGSAILAFLIDICVRQGIRPIAGCWYYNHRSKKTLERAGMFSQTRLFKINY
jgi:GNAT superfamily N-acetyltransferase